MIITDKLKSYGAAKREILPGVEYRQHRYLNNRAENSHQPTRQRERRLQGLNPQGTPSAFLRPMGRLPNTSAHDGIASQPTTTGERWRNDSRAGGKSRVWP